MEETGSVPNAIHMLNKHMSLARQQEIQTALKTFADVSEEGQQFMLKFRYGGFKPISASALKPMEIYAAQVQRLLEVGK